MDGLVVLEPAEVTPPLSHDTASTELDSTVRPIDASVADTVHWMDAHNSAESL